MIILMKSVTNNSSDTLWDVLVIGGGPAGMMAALHAKEQAPHKKVILLEKNSSLGKKLLITGGGRCNVTNSEFDTRKFLAHYKESDKFLFSAFAQYGVKETLDFFHERNMPTKVENEGRTFPRSDSAKSVWNVLVHGMEKSGVVVMTDAQVLGFEFAKKERELLGVHVSLKGKNTILKSKAYVLATGGTSHPETGSTGDAYPWLTLLGHTVVIPKPVLVPITIQDAWVKDLQGLTVNPVKITVRADDEKKVSKKGKILFTHFGVTGPTILNLSKQVGDMLANKKQVHIYLDFLPDQDHGNLNQSLQDLFVDNKSKKIKNTLDQLLPARVAETVLSHSKIDIEKVCSQITREERMTLIESIKNISMKVKSLLGEDKAIIASGGVPLSEIDFKTMRSKVCPNVYIVGDLLDIDRPSGGYSLQLCWTTGYVAGKSAVSSVDDTSSILK